MTRLTTSKPGRRFEYVDRSDAPDDQFAPLLDRIEAADTVDIGEDARVEAVAIALWRSDTEDEFPDAEIERLWPKVVSHFPNDAAAYRRLATAALAAMHPAHETLRARLEALAVRWESLDLGVGLYPEDSAHRSAHEDRAEACAEDLRAALGGEQ